MAAITPMLDTMLPQVLGRLGDLERASAEFPKAPLGAVQPIRGGQAAVDGRPAATARSRAGAQLAASAPAAASNAVSDSTAAAGHGRLSAQLHLSRTGESLAALLQRFVDAPAVDAGRGSALFNGPGAPNVGVLAGILAGQISQSGVFYEAHLLAWLQGRYPRSRLDREPQARLAARDAGSTKALAGNRSQRTGGDHDGEPAQGTQAAAVQHAPAAAVDERLASVLRQQMELFATGAFQWQGQAWPDAPLQWEVREDEASDRSSAGEPLASFTTSLKLQLPVLGDLEVRISLAGSAVSVHAWAHQEDGRGLLRADLATLRSRLARSGFEPAFVELFESQRNL